MFNDDKNSNNDNDKRIIGKKPRRQRQKETDWEYCCIHNNINSNINNDLQREAPPFMFDQNIDTSINPIQQTQNNESNNDIQQPTPMVNNQVENLTIPQPANQPQNTQANENQNLQPVTSELQPNGINNIENQPQPSTILEQNEVANTMEPQPVQLPQDNAFKYEIPVQTEQPQPVNQTQTVSMNENQNLQPATPAPQPVSPNPNVVNNQNNSNL